MYQQVPYVLYACPRTANSPPWRGVPGLAIAGTAPAWRPWRPWRSQHPAINTEAAVTPEGGQTHNAMGCLLTLAAVALMSAPRVSDADASHDAEAQGHGGRGDLS